MRVSITDEQLRAAFEHVRNDPAFAESAAVAATGQRPAEMIQAMALRPGLLGVLAAASDTVYPGGIVEREVKELIILEASRANACQFCRDSHIVIARSLGISDDPIALLDRPDDQTGRQRLALEYTRAAAADSNRVPDELFERLRGCFTEEEIVEVTFMIAFITALNLFNNALRVAYRDDYVH